jgi:hypothetical protein
MLYFLNQRHRGRILPGTDPVAGPSLAPSLDSSLESSLPIWRSS